MRRKLIPFLATALLFASCQKPEADQVQSATEEGTLVVNIAQMESLQTKAVTSYTGSQPYETATNSVQLFVFDEKGRLGAYRNMGKSLTTSLSIIQGKKTVYALINAPVYSTVKTLAELESKVVDLSDNSTAETKGFIMAGKGSCTVGAGTATCAVTVSRLAARVALKSVTNNLPSQYGAITINRIFLSNVSGNMNIAGTAQPTKWYNKEGRMDEATRVESHIINGSNYTASVPELTYKSPGITINNSATHTPSVPYLFYTYANTSTVDPTGFKATYTPQRSVLVVVATVGGNTYYYPVILKTGTLNRNTTYTVGLTITGLGSDDPNRPVSKGTLSATVTVEGWKSGDIYDETI